jgi:hypothetical protein
MAKVNIIIKGVAMSYHKGDGIWKIIFPFGECHLVKFKETENELGIALAGKNRRIRIRTENPQSTFEVGDDYNDFLDLTADYSHANGVKMQAGWEDRAVLMTMENTRLSVAEHTQSEHLVVKAKIVTLEPTKIGYSYKAEIESEKVIVEVDNHPDFPKVFDNDQTIIFDNDCQMGETRKTTDFEMVYNVIEDAAQKTEHFEVAKVSVNSKSSIVAGDVYEAATADEAYKDSYIDGLPCHGIRISKIDNLL